jgi:hypothetical protein
MLLVAAGRNNTDAVADSTGGDGRRQYLLRVGWLFLVRYRKSAS